MSRLQTFACVCLFTVVVFAPLAAETPRGSITIERISHIKYPSAPAWSPDGKSIAFLWDAWGKQEHLQSLSARFHS